MHNYLLSLLYAGFLWFWLALVAFCAASTIRICVIAVRKAWTRNKLALLVGGGVYGLCALDSELFQVVSVLLATIAVCSGFVRGLVWAIDLLNSVKLKSFRRVYAFVIVGVLLDLMADLVRHQI